MWLLQLMGLVVVVGVVAGLVWRVVEDWLERRAAAKEAVANAVVEHQSTVVDAPVSTPVPVVVGDSANKPN